MHILYAAMKGFKSYPFCGHSDYYRYKHDEVYVQNDLNSSGDGKCYEHNSEHCDNFWQNTKYFWNTFDKRKFPLEEEEI